MNPLHSWLENAQENWAADILMRLSLGFSMRNECAEKARPFCRGGGRGGNAILKSFLKKTKQSLQTGCLFPVPLPFLRIGLPGLSLPAGREGSTPSLGHTFSPALPLGGNMNAADSKIRHFCGSWQGLRSPPPRPWNTESAPPAPARAFWGPQPLLQPQGWTSCQELP